MLRPNLSDMESRRAMAKSYRGNAVIVLAILVAAAAAYLLMEQLEVLSSNHDTIVVTVAIAGSIAGMVLSAIALLSTRGTHRRAAVAGTLFLLIAGVAFLAELVPGISTLDRVMYPVLGAGSTLLGVLTIVGAYRGLVGTADSSP